MIYTSEDKMKFQGCTSTGSVPDFGELNSRWLSLSKPEMTSNK